MNAREAAPARRAPLLRTVFRSFAIPLPATAAALAIALYVDEARDQEGRKVIDLYALQEQRAKSLRATTPTLPAAYVRAVSPELARLSRSATRLGIALASIGAPSDLERLRRRVEAERRSVAATRRALIRAQPEAAGRPSPGRLLPAATAHARFLSLLSRTLALESSAAPSALVTVEQAGARAGGLYRAFFRAAGVDGDSISSSGMTDLSGVRFTLESLAREER